MQKLISALVGTLLLAGPASAEVDFDNNPFTGDEIIIKDPSPPAVRNVVIFDNQAEFLAAVGSVVTEDFEDEAVTADCGSGAVTMLSFDDFTATSNPAALKVVDQECTGSHNMTPGGAKYLLVDTDAGGVTGVLTITYNAPITAFGLYLTDLDSNPAQVMINGAPYSVGPHGNGGHSYFGIISDDAFSVIGIDIVSGFDSSYALDDVAHGMISTAVESSTWGRIKTLLH